jgi:glycosyltransferase involved in cell wall biosynthesis
VSRYSREIKLSIIVPVFNQEKLVIRALESIPKINDIEVIVIDDGSTDNTWNNLLNYRNKYLEVQDIVLLYNKINKGVGYTVNRGLDNANGEYIVLLGSDDYFTSNFEDSLKLLDGTDLIYFNLMDNKNKIWIVNEETKNILVGSVKFMRREFIENTRNPEIRAREDAYFYQDLMKKKPTEKFTGIVLKHYNFPRKNSLSWLSEKGMI